MGLFPLAATLSSMRPAPHLRTARHWWPSPIWRRCGSNMQCRIGNPPLQLDPFRPTTSRLQSQFPAISRQAAGRAPQRIQRAPLSGRRSSTAAPLRRWMLPTVERGPPVT
jgi:hypothetical protein